MSTYPKSDDPMIDEGSSPLSSHQTMDSTVSGGNPLLGGQLPKGWLLGGVILCIIVSFVVMIFGEQFTEMISDIAFALIIAFLANNFTKKLGVAHIPANIIVFIVATYPYGPILEFALLSDSLFIALLLILWPIWVVTFGIYLAVLLSAQSATKQNSGNND